MLAKLLPPALQTKINSLARTIGRNPRFEDIAPLSGMTEGCLDIVRLTLSAMSIDEKDWVRSSEDGLYGFHNVPMHTDGIHPRSVVTLFIPVKGHGELACFGQGHIQQHFFHGSRSLAVALDDHKPHSFCTLSNCYAILTGVNRRAVLV